MYVIQNLEIPSEIGDKAFKKEGGPKHKIQRVLTLLQKGLKYEDEFLDEGYDRSPFFEILYKVYPGPKETNKKSMAVWWNNNVPNQKIRLEIWSALRLYLEKVETDRGSFDRKLLSLSTFLPKYRDHIGVFSPRFKEEEAAEREVKRIALRITRTEALGTKDADLITDQLLAGE